MRRAVGTVPELPGGDGWLFCEVGEDEGDPRSAVERAADLVAASACVDHRVVEDASESRSAVAYSCGRRGLAGRTPAGNQAWPGWEDAAVPPANLGPYLTDFEAPAAKYGIEGLSRALPSATDVCTCDGCATQRRR